MKKSHYNTIDIQLLVPHAKLQNNLLVSKGKNEDELEIIQSQITEILTPQCVSAA